MIGYRFHDEPKTDGRAPEISDMIFDQAETPSNSFRVGMFGNTTTSSEALIEAGGFLELGSLEDDI